MTSHHLLLMAILKVVTRIFVRESSHWRLLNPFGNTTFTH